MAHTQLPEWVTIESESIYHQSKSMSDKPDGLSLYRSISRQMYGDPRNYKQIMNCILDHFLRVWVDSSHSLHNEYTSLETYTFNQSMIKTFVGAIACPDVALGQWNEEADAQRTLLDFIANALNVSIIACELPNPSEQEKTSPMKRPKRRVSSFGDASFPVYHILAHPSRRVSGELYTLTAFDSVFPDYTGKSLIQYLSGQKIKSRKLDIKEMHWWWDEQEYQNFRNESAQKAYDRMDCDNYTRVKERFEGIECYNEYEKGEISGVLPTNSLNSFSIFTVNVTEPDQIQSAIELLKQAIRKAPGQEMPMPYRLLDGNYKPLRRYVAIDAEFLPVELPPAFNYEAATGRFKITNELRKGRSEQLCNILTIAVDRHLVISFYVLHMLYNANEKTVPALSKLFEETIFNTDFLKFWWNYEKDFEVLNATIAHMFQRTPRERFEDAADRWLRRDHPLKGYWIEPTFKFSSKYFDNERPKSLTFRTDKCQCEFHTDQLSTQDLRCPCYAFNLDLSKILDYICRQFGPSSEYYPAKMGWTVNRRGSKYENLLKWWFEGFRLFPILESFKDSPYFSPQGTDGFYAGLVPGMELDHEKMGYNIGDVVGLALIVRFLLTSDNRVAFATKLASWVALEEQRPIIRIDSERYQRPAGNFPLIDDFPRTWQRDCLDVSDTPNENGNYFQNYLGRGVDRKGNVLSLSYMEHDEQALVAKRVYSEVIKKSQSPNDDNTHINHALQLAYGKLFDPTRFTLPGEIFTVSPKPRKNPIQNRQAIVRAGMAHSDDLIKFIRSARSIRRNAPLGFMVPAGKPNGLPLKIGRTAGESLTKADLILAAFKYRAHNDPPPSPIITPQPMAFKDIDLEAEQRVIATRWGHKPEPFIFEESWVPIKRGRSQKKYLAAQKQEHQLAVDSWNWGLEIAKQEIESERAEQIKKAHEKDETEGKVGKIDPSDIFDPEERSHKKNLQRGPRYNAIVKLRGREAISTPKFATVSPSKVGTTQSTTAEAPQKRKLVLSAEEGQRKRRYGLREIESRRRRL